MARDPNAPIEPGEFDDDLTHPESIRRLAARLVFDTVADACSETPPRAVKREDEARTRAHAYAWLTARSGGFAEDREFWTAVAGLDDEAIREAVLRVAPTTEARVDFAGTRARRAALPRDRTPRGSPDGW